MTMSPSSAGNEPPNDAKQAQWHIGHDLLEPFVVNGDEQNFLADIIRSRLAPIDELRKLFRLSLTTGAEDWEALIDCGRSLQTRGTIPNSPSGDGLLKFASCIFRGCQADLPAALREPWYETDGLIAQLRGGFSTTLPYSDSASPNQLASKNSAAPPPWHETDQLLIGLARQLEHRTSPVLSCSNQAIPCPQDPWYETDRLIEQFKRQTPAALPSYTAGTPGDAQPSTRRNSSPPPPKQTRRSVVRSHYWDHDVQEDDGEGCRISTTFLLAHQAPTLGARRDANSTSRGLEELPKPEQLHVDFIKTESRDRNVVTAGSRSTVSPYFLPVSPPQTPSPKRPPPGTVSCLPFPPLDAESFGLIQEKVAHEPFWLLVAITFLIRTKGTAAIPVFYAVKERFRSPELVADPANADEILGMIRHLGLSMNRLGFLQKYARTFVDNPPQAGKVYRVKNYDQRDVGRRCHEPIIDNMRETTTGMLTPKEDDEDAEAWEIGHMTQGKYALDSWRIFCRDVLLGRADGWNGEGAEEGFQPEWMRVRPDDKELRAYLRWMWMREGWEWDPVTGERTVLRADMLGAVNEGMVEYDDCGGLRILDDEPQAA